MPNPLTPTADHSDRFSRPDCPTAAVGAVGIRSFAIRYSPRLPDRRSARSAFAILITTAFSITLALLAAHRLRGQALAALIGLAIGAAATILTTLLLATYRRRPAAPPPPVPLSPGLQATRSVAVPLSHIPSLTAAEQTLADDQYWRGYQQGWIHAAAAMLDLATDHHLPPQAAYHACARHWQTLLPYHPRDRRSPDRPSP